MVNSAAVFQFLSFGTALLFLAPAACTATDVTNALRTGTENVLGESNTGKNQHRHGFIHTFENFLSREEIETFQGNLHIDSFTSTYGYGKVDVSYSFVERVKSVLQQVDADAATSNGQAGKFFGWLGLSSCIDLIIYLPLTDVFLLPSCDRSVTSQKAKSSFLLLPGSFVLLTRM